ncbi:MAG: PDZ domain-containing protein [Bacteroidia bacterium]|nr:PDZ domain-containing protein [Bacteroidia bacterium]
MGHVYPGGAGDKAGLRTGDILLAVDGVPIQTQAELLERLAQKRPGDRVQLLYRRHGKLYETTATLTNEDGEPTILKREVYQSEALGAEIVAISAREAQRLGISRGFRFQNLRGGGLISQMGLPEGFILLRINGYAPESPREVEQILQRVRGRLNIEGVDAQGRRLYLNFTMR